MTNPEFVSPQISPRILSSIASLYDSPSRVIMEYIDNSFDSADIHSYDPTTESYIRPIEVNITLDDRETLGESITITDNCKGMDTKGLLRIICEIGNSDKKEQPWTNGQFGYGVYSFMAVCEHLEIVSKVEDLHPLEIKLDRKSFDKDYLTDVKLPAPKPVHGRLQGKSGTIVTLSGFDKRTWREIDIRELKQEIENHFELLLRRKNLTVSVLSSGSHRMKCIPFDYEEYVGECYRTETWDLDVPQRKGVPIRKTRHLRGSPLKVFLKVTEDADIGRRPIIVAKGRRIAEVKDLRKFTSRNKQTIWNHAHLTGYIDTGDFADPTIARNDFRQNEKSKALFSFLEDIEPHIDDLLKNLNRSSEERHYRELEDALTRALAELARMDSITMAYRTDYITGNEVNLQPGSDGRSLTGDHGGKDRGDGHSRGGRAIGENEGEGTGMGDQSGILPGGSDGNGAPKCKVMDNPDEESGFRGRERRKSGFNIRIVDREPVIDAQTSKPLRSQLAGNTIEIFKQHHDFQERVERSRVGVPRITQRLITYLAGEVTVHYKDVFHNKASAPEYGKWMFINLVESIYWLEDKLSFLVGKNLSYMDNG